MKKIQKHSDKNIGKSMATYILLERLSSTRFKSFTDFLSDKHTDDIDKERLWKINQLFALVVVIENALICNKHEEYKNFKSAQKNKIKNEIIARTSRNYSVDKSNAAKILYKQTKGDANRLFTPRILQVDAGYNLGDLVALIENNFPNDVVFIKQLKKLKTDRNFVFHNLTSSVADIDKKLDSAIKLANKLNARLG